MDSKNNRVLVNLGVCLDKLNKLKDAQKMYQEALQVNDRDPKTYNNLAINLKKQNKLNESLD